VDLLILLLVVLVVDLLILLLADFQMPLGGLQSVAAGLLIKSHKRSS
jgi:hypothetical protein